MNCVFFIKVSCVSFKALEDLLIQDKTERETVLASLGPWSDSICVANTEEELSGIFNHTSQVLIKELGEPIYQGDGSIISSDAPDPNNYFDATESSVRIAWWNGFGGEVALFHTSHDADTLQFVILAISASCVQSNA